MDLSNKELRRPEELPIGIDDYKELIDKKCIYIDKTLLIKEFSDARSKVTLITRPRRFGKSITLSMLRYFFEKTDQSTTYLFENSKIWKYEEFQKLQGTYPVILISFKDIKAKTWGAAYLELKQLLANEVLRVLRPFESQMKEPYKSRYEALINQTATEVGFNESLAFITKVFKECSGLKTIILIDEYDTPITRAYMHNYYEEMTDFMCQLLSKALKGNDYLEKALMTGVVRTAKDGILSGLNNPDIYTMLEGPFSDKLGFTEAETDQLLSCIGRLDKKEELKSWYNGYIVGVEQPLPSKIYNPWSVLGYLKHSCSPKTYWANTGSSELLERLIAEANEETQKELLLLVEGKSLEKKQIDQNVILLNLDEKGHEPWSFLFFAGYITAIDHLFEDNKHYYTLAVPNLEIAELYKELVIGAIGRTFSSAKLDNLHAALIKGDVDTFQRLLEDFILSMCSFHDLPHNDLERSIHLFVLGLLASLMGRYVIKSNLESGIGRYDISLHPRNAKDPAILIELKKLKKGKKENKRNLELLADEALQQIKDNKYESLTKNLGYKGKVLCYGVATFKKLVAVKMETKNLD